MVAIGEGTKQAAMKQMEQLGATNILIRAVRPPQSNDASSRTQRTLIYGLTRADLARIQALPGLRKIVPLRDTEQKVICGDLRINANAIGTTPDVFDVMNLRLARGTYFTQLDCEQDKPVCVIGATAAQQLFPYQDPLGQTIQIGTSYVSTVMVTIVGVLEPTGLRAGSEGAAMLQHDPDQDVYFPLSLAKIAFGDTIVNRQAGGMERKQIELSEIWIQVNGKEDVEPFAAVADNLLDAYHPQVDYQVKAPLQILRNAEKLNRMFNFIMVGIASFSLVVGGIGIMNIMLATVTERTREIGIRRALGAKRRHITLQFLIETTIISLTGGLIGISLGASAATLLPIVVQHFSSQNYPTLITTWSVLGSFIVSGAIGIGFGLYPAIMAARMNPIEALRYQ
jgi:putative ABC transport system permease protein